MAYFSNSSDGILLDRQCSKCKYGNLACPIAMVQINYNYEACNDEVARNILDGLINDDGICQMFETFKEDFQINE